MNNSKIKIKIKKLKSKLKLKLELKINENLMVTLSSVGVYVAKGAYDIYPGPAIFKFIKKI